VRAVRSRLIAALLAAVALTLPADVATADEHVSEVVSFDPSAGEFAEGSPSTRPVTST
jgi:hypothetical protein